MHKNLVLDIALLRER